MPKYITPSWALVTGGQTDTISSGADGKLAYYDGAGTALNDAAGLLWDDTAETLQITGTLDVSGTINAQIFNSVTVNDTTYAGTTKFGNDVSDVHQFSGSVHSTGLVSAMGYGNPSTISTSTNVPVNYNFRLFGPITIASGVDFHVGSGSEVKII